MDFEQAKKYKRYAPIGLYLGADRPDIQHAISVLMRGMANPKVLDELRLKRLASYLKKFPQV